MAKIGIILTLACLVLAVTSSYNLEELKMRYHHEKLRGHVHFRKMSHEIRVRLCGDDLYEGLKFVCHGAYNSPPGEKKRSQNYNGLTLGQLKGQKTTFIR